MKMNRWYVSGLNYFKLMWVRADCWCYKRCVSVTITLYIKSHYVSHVCACVLCVCVCVCLCLCVWVVCNYLFLLTTNHLHTHPEAFSLATSVFQFHFLSHIIKLECSPRRLHPRPLPAPYEPPCVFLFIYGTHWMQPQASKNIWPNWLAYENTWALDWNLIASLS